MNKQRRVRIEKIRQKLVDMHADLEELRDELESVKEDEMGAFEAMPESLKEAERGQQAEAALDELDNAYSALDTAVSEIDSAMSSMENAIE